MSTNYYLLNGEINIIKITILHLQWFDMRFNGVDYLFWITTISDWLIECWKYVNDVLVLFNRIEFNLQFCFELFGCEFFSLSLFHNKFLGRHIEWSLILRIDICFFSFFFLSVKLEIVSKHFAAKKCSKIINKLSQ